MITFLDKDKMTHAEIVILKSLDKKYSFISRSVLTNDLFIWERMESPNYSERCVTSTSSDLLPYPGLFSYIEPGKIYNLAFIEGNEYKHFNRGGISGGSE